MKCKSMTKAAALWELYEQASYNAEMWLDLWRKESMAYWFYTRGAALYKPQHG